MSNHNISSARADAFGTATITPETLSGLAGTGKLSPTVSEFLNAANVAYVGGTPDGLTPFEVNGAQLKINDILTGVVGEVWETASNQVIVAFQGTTSVSQLIADIGIGFRTVTPGEIEATKFVRTAITDAKAQGIGSRNLFVTGHSLGGIEAEYAAQQTGVGGMAFEATGLPVDSTAGTGKNFIDVVTYGDPIGNYSSDIKGEQPLAPAYVAGGGSLPHYGTIVMVGDPADQTTLSHNALNIVGLAGLLVDFHLPGTQAHDLGVTLNPYSGLIDGLGDKSAPVYNVANDTIGQLKLDYRLNHSIDIPALSGHMGM